MSVIFVVFAIAFLWLGFGSGQKLAAFKGLFKLIGTSLLVMAGVFYLFGLAIWIFMGIALLFVLIAAFNCRNELRRFFRSKNA